MIKRPFFYDVILIALLVINATQTLFALAPRGIGRNDF